MWQFIWWIFTLILSEVLRPKPKDAPTASLGDFQFPTAEDGRAIPIAIGTVLVGGSNITWYGDLLKDKIRKKSGLFGGSTVVGAQYYLGFQAAICGPVDELVGLRWDDKPVNYTQTTDGDKEVLEVDDAFLFGGKDSEGGIVGTMDFYLGTDTQTPNDYLETQFGAGLVPAYRGVSYAVARQMYLGTTKYVKSPAWEVRHCPNSLGLTGDKHVIDGRAANPAAAIYYILTDEDFGAGMPAGEIDTATFTAVADTCYDEGLGVNFLFDSFSVAGELVEEILRHIDGFHYIDPETGLFGIGLVRDDYVLEDLETIGEDEISSIEVREPSWSDLVNYITVEYVDADYRKVSLPWPNLAGIERRGEIESRTVAYHGFDSDSAARRVAARLSKRAAYPLKSVDFTVNRTAWNFRNGTPFLWSGFPYSIEARVMRVYETELGSYEDGKIRLSAVEDIFSIDSLAYGSPVSDFVDPVQDPEELTSAFLLETPYHINAGSESIQALIVAPRENTSIVGAEIYLDRSGGTSYAQGGDVELFHPLGQLTADYDPGMSVDSVGFTVDGGLDLALLASVTEAEFSRGINLALIGDELFAWRDVTDNGDGTYTISRVIRGVFDTVPRPHSEDDSVYFLTSFTAFDEDPLAADGSVNVKLRPYTDRSIMDLTDVSAISITTDSRAARAYPPGNVKVNGEVDPPDVDSDAVITWSHRNRATQYAEDQVVEQSTGGSYSAEGDYLLEFWIEGSMRSSTTTSSATYTYTEAQRTTDYGADLLAEVEVRIYGRNSDLSTQSTFYQRLQFSMFAAS